MSSISLINQINSQITWAIALNSASALLHATTDSFLLLQVTRFSHSLVQKLGVNRLFIIDPTQSASTKPSALFHYSFGTIIPSLVFPLGILKCDEL